MTPRTRATVAVLAGLLGGLLAAPAHAERGGYDDPADATASLNDIYALDVVHGAEQVSVGVHVDDLRARSDAGPAGLTVFLDGDPARKGPELALTTGLQAGTDYQLLRVRRWRLVGEPLGCDHQVRLRFRPDVVRVRVARTCLGDPDRVRVAVKMLDEYDGSHPVVDWVRAYRRMTPWLRSA